MTENLKVTCKKKNLKKPQLTPSKADVQHTLCQSAKWPLPRAGDTGAQWVHVMCDGVF